MKDPETTEEWQEAVNLSDLYLRVDSARAYGLLTGGPEVDTERCQEILDRGAKKRIHPTWSDDQRAAVLMELHGVGVE